MGIPRGATHPAFEAAQIAHAKAAVLDALLDTIVNDPNMMPGSDSTQIIRQEIEAQIANYRDEERAMAHRHFLYLIGDGDE